MAAPCNRDATARAEVYRFLALAFADPAAGRARDLRRHWPVVASALAVLGLPERDAGMAKLTDAALRRAHLACFGYTLSKECPPYETEYGQAHIFEKTQTLADIAGFYRAFGLDLAGTTKERPDHLAIELEFMEFLCRKHAFAVRNDHAPERIAMCCDAERKFLDEHLGRWVFGFARRVGGKARGGPYAGLVGLLEAFVDRELEAMGLARHAVPFLNEGDLDRADDTACGDCPVASDGAPLHGGVQP